MRGFQRRYLRSQAHHLKPVIFIGKNGLTDALLEKLDRELNAHELIKLRFVEFKPERRELTEQLATSSRSEIAGIIGHTAILYRAHRDPEKRRKVYHAVANAGLPVFRIGGVICARRCTLVRWIADQECRAARTHASPAFVDAADINRTDI